MFQKEVDMSVLLVAIWEEDKMMTAMIVKKNGSNGNGNGNGGNGNGNGGSGNGGNGGGNGGGGNGGGGGGE